MGSAPTGDYCEGLTLDFFSVTVGVIATLIFQGVVVSLKWMLGKATHINVSGHRKETSVTTQVSEKTVNLQVSDALMQLKKDELVTLCRSRQLKASGTKAELVHRFVLML